MEYKDPEKYKYAKLPDEQFLSGYRVLILLYVLSTNGSKHYVSMKCKSYIAPTLRSWFIHVIVIWTHDVDRCGRSTHFRRGACTDIEAVI